jgi:peptidoglycan/LPS O-acetylase OafA/YrhL
MRAGQTIYYFFVCLLFLTAIAYGAMCLNKVAAAYFVVFSLIVVVTLPIITIVTNMPKLSAWWHPLPFLPYAVVSALLAKHEPVIDRWRLGIACLLLAASFMVGLLEWKFYMNPVYFSIQPYAMPAYMRPSLVFSAYGLLLLAIGFKAEIPRWMRYMADRSLGLYCLHPFFMLPVNEFAPRCFSMMSNVMARTVLVIGLSYAAIWVLHFFVKEDFLLVSRRQ